MVSSYTPRNRLLKQGTGDNSDTWGALQSAQDFDMTDEALDGWAAIPVAAAVTLTSSNGVSDQARMRNLMLTGAGGFPITLPAVSKFYNVWNACAAACSITNGSASVTVQPGECVGVINDGAANMARVQPTDFGGKRITSAGSPTSSTDAATKGYVDAQAFAALSGNLPGQTGSAGDFLKTDGTTASWTAVHVADIADYVTDQATRATALNSTAQGYANTAQANAQSFAVCVALLY